MLAQCLKVLNLLQNFLKPPKLNTITLRRMDGIESCGQMDSDWRLAVSDLT